MAFEGGKKKKTKESAAAAHPQGEEAAAKPQIQVLDGVADADDDEEDLNTYRRKTVRHYQRSALFERLNNTGLSSCFLLQDLAELVNEQLAKVIERRPH